MHRQSSHLAPNQKPLPFRAMHPNIDNVTKNRRPARERRPPGEARGGRLLVEFDQLLEVVEAGLGGGFGLGEEVFGAVGEFAGE